MSVLRALLPWLLCFNVALAFAADVPVDAPRGSYVGADNIHWYRQESLKYEDFYSNGPRHGSYSTCNAEQLDETCTGESMFNEHELFDGVGIFPVDVVVLADSRAEFNWRIALQGIRRTNRVLENSGLPIRLVVKHIQTENFAPLGDIFGVFDHYDSINVDDTYELLDRHEADVLVISHVFDPSLMGDDGSGAITCGLGNLEYFYGTTPVALSACDLLPNDYTLAHEIGHILGLFHDVDNDQNLGFYPPELPYGRGYCNNRCEVGTVMSYAFDVVPFFSKEDLVIDGRAMFSDGSVSEPSDAARAARHFAIGLSLLWENRSSSLAAASAAGAGASLSTRSTANAHGRTCVYKPRHLNMGNIMKSLPSAIR